MNKSKLCVLKHNWETPINHCMNDAERRKSQLSKLCLLEPSKPPSLSSSSSLKEHLVLCSLPNMCLEIWLVQLKFGQIAQIETNVHSIWVLLPFIPLKIFYHRSVLCHIESHLVVVPPLGLVFRTHLTNQFLHFGSSQWILCRHRVRVTGSVDPLRRIVVGNLVGAVGASPWRCLIIQPWWCSKIEIWI